MTDYQTYLLLQFICYYPHKVTGLWRTTGHGLGLLRFFCKRGSLEFPGREGTIQSRIRPGGRVVLERWLNGELAYRHPSYQEIVDESQTRLRAHMERRGYLPQYEYLLDLDDRK